MFPTYIKQAGADKTNPDAYVGEKRMHVLKELSPFPIPFEIVHLS